MSKLEFILSDKPYKKIIYPKPDFKFAIGDRIQFYKQSVFSWDFGKVQLGDILTVEDCGTEREFCRVGSDFIFYTLKGTHLRAEHIEADFKLVN
jgi:hypothetical protein